MTAALVADSRAVLAKHARSFQTASWLLPGEARDDAAVLYAFCRLVDDIADECDDKVVARRDLEALQAELRKAVEPRPLVVLLHAVAARRGMDLRAAEELIDGALTDLDPVVIADEAELMRYCYLVAGTVGVLMCGVLGVTDAHARSHAVALGEGMQLTNICRDVAEDAGIGRVYVPASLLEAQGQTSAAVLDGTVDRAALARVVRTMLGTADERYAHGFAGMGFIPARTRAAILVAAHLYRSIGLRLVDKHGADPMHGRTIVPGPGRAWAVVKGLRDHLRLLLTGRLALA